LRRTKKEKIMRLSRAVSTRRVVLSRVADRFFFLLRSVPTVQKYPSDRTGLAGPWHVARTSYVEVLRSTYQPPYVIRTHVHRCSRRPPSSTIVHGPWSKIQGLHDNKEEGKMQLEFKFNKHLILENCNTYYYFMILGYLKKKRGKNGCYCLTQALTTVKNPYLCDCSYFLIAGSASCKKTSSLAVCGANLA
jgi:hypothetical protein